VTTALERLKAVDQAREYALTQCAALRAETHWDEQSVQVLLRICEAVEDAVDTYAGALTRYVEDCS
jgi:hypothetical protein